MSKMTHPTYHKMILEAICALNQHYGCSRILIKNFIESNYNIVVATPHLRHAIRMAVKDGTLEAANEKSTKFRLSRKARGERRRYVDIGASHIILSPAPRKKSPKTSTNGPEVNKVESNKDGTIQKRVLKKASKNLIFTMNTRSYKKRAAKKTARVMSPVMSAY